MTKRKHKQPKDAVKDHVAKAPKTDLYTLRLEVDLWYRLHVLLYDLSHVATDPSSERRISSTTNELYISEPYFTDSEAQRIRNADVVVVECTDEKMEETGDGDGAEVVTTGIDDGVKDEASSPTTTNTTTVEEAIHLRLSNFFSKRKASGDARPCGPHDMLPIYLSVFGVNKEESKDERFLSRVRRSGLGRG